ncbi:phage tail tip lysozyme [Methylobacterium sp. E-005]|nr:phage tail tip lysozyme [Methylobacterium sp. E-005]
MGDTIKSFAIALGFDIDKASFNDGKKTLDDYENAVKAAQKRIDDALWEEAKTEEQIAKLSRETALKEAKQALSDAQAREKLEKEAAHKRDERNKAFVAGVEKMALAATAAATAITYAVTRVAGAFDHLGFVSARTGASVQSLNSLGYAFKQTGGTAEQAVSAVESFTKAMRENSGVKGFVAGLGVDMDKDKVDQLLDTVRILQTHGYDSGSREAGLAGISEETYALLVKYIDQIDRYRAEYDNLTKSLGVNSKEATEASMAFQRSLTRLQATASALGDKLIVSLAPAIQRIVDRFQDWIRSNPQKVEHIMDGISKALVWVVDKIGALIESVTGSNGDEFIKKWDAFSERAERLATAVERIAKASSQVSSLLDKFNSVEVSGAGSLSTWLLEKMGLMPAGSSGGVRNGVSFDEQRERAAEDQPGMFRRAARAVKRAFSGGSADAHGGDGGLPAEDDGTITTHGHRWKPGANSAGGKERVASWLKFFQAPVSDGGMGADLETSRAMVAMMQGESTANLDPTIKGDLDPSGRPTSFGTAQWHAERFTQLKAFAARMGTDWTDVGAQQQFLRDEFLRGRYRGVWNQIKGAATGEDKLRAGIDGYENPKFKQKAYDFRLPNLHALRRSGAGVAPAEAASSSITVPPSSTMRGLPNMTPGGFDPNRIDPSNVMQPAPVGASPVTNNTTSSSNKAVHQTFNNNTTIHEARNAKEAGRTMTDVFDRMHGLALENAQTAVI